MPALMEREIMLEQSIRFATIEELNQFATEEETLDTLAKQNDTQYVIEAATALQDLLEMALLHLQSTSKHLQQRFKRLMNSRSLTTVYTAISMLYGRSGMNLPMPPLGNSSILPAQNSDPISESSLVGPRPRISAHCLMNASRLACGRSVRRWIRQFPTTLGLT